MRSLVCWPLSMRWAVTALCYGWGPRESVTLDLPSKATQLIGEGSHISPMFHACFDMHPRVLGVAVAWSLECKYFSWKLREKYTLINFDSVFQIPVASLETDSLPGIFHEYKQLSQGRSNSRWSKLLMVVESWVHCSGVSSLSHQVSYNWLQAEWLRRSHC